MVPHLALLPSVLQPFRVRYPGVRLDLIDAVFPTVASRLSDGTIDCYIGPPPEGRTRWARQRASFREHAGHRRSKGASKVLRQIVGRTLGRGVDDHVDHVSARAGARAPLRAAWFAATEARPSGALGVNTDRVHHFFGPARDVADPVDAFPTHQRRTTDDRRRRGAACATDLHRPARGPAAHPCG